VDGFFLDYSQLTHSTPRERRTHLCILLALVVLARLAATECLLRHEHIEQCHALRPHRLRAR
jgi:hypothetical protein